MQTATRWQDIAGDSKDKYGLYLCSREWCELREAVRTRSGNICERCKRNPMDAAHHLTYVRKYAERLEDLQAICNGCHEFTHGKSDFDPAAFIPITEPSKRPLINVSEESWILCPICGDIYVHPQSIFVRQNSFVTEIIGLKSVSSSIGPSGARGSSITMTYWGECGHKFAICFEFHKGNTQANVIRLHDEEVGAPGSDHSELWRD